MEICFLHSVKCGRSGARLAETGTRSTVALEDALEEVRANHALGITVFALNT